MNSIFIEKYALIVEPYSKIKADLSLTTEQFNNLKKSLSTEIEIARKVRQVYLRKKVKSLSIQKFYEWWTQQEKKCCYCDITPDQLVIIFEKLKDRNKRPTRGKSLELDRRISNESYNEIDNLFFCCYMCNNAKSDFFTHEQFIPIGQAIKHAWQEILNKK